MAAVSASLAILASKAIAEKFVALGFLPRSFLGIVPALQQTVRIVGALLVLSGLVGISITNGWIDPEIMRKYGFSVGLVLIGTVLLIVTRKR